MTNSDVGKRILLWIAWCVWAVELSAAPERTLWLVEQPSLASVPTMQGAQRSYVTANIVQYGDAFSSQVSFSVPLYYVDVLTGGAIRNGSGAVANQRYFFFGEAARYFVNAREEFGRIALGYLYAYPIDRPWLRIHLDTGRLETAAVPWGIHLQLAYWLPLKDSDSRVWIGGHAYRSIDLSAHDHLRLGVSLKAAVRIQPTTAPSIGATEDFENLLILFGPEVDWRGDLGHWKFFARWRLWLDRGVTQVDASTTKTVFPSELFGVPDVGLQWSLGL